MDLETEMGWSESVMSWCLRVSRFGEVREGKLANKSGPDFLGAPLVVIILECPPAMMNASGILNRAGNGEINTDGDQ